MFKPLAVIRRASADGIAACIASLNNPTIAPRPSRFGEVAQHRNERRLHNDLICPTEALLGLGSAT